MPLENFDVSVSSAGPVMRLAGLQLHWIAEVLAKNS
jgi:hypothetical protein